MLDAGRLVDERALLASWGDVIRRYRQWKQLSRRELAQRAGLSPVFLGEIERGEKDPSSHSLCSIAEGLNVDLGELYMRVAMRLEGEEHRHRDSQSSLPLGTRETESDYLDGVPRERDETAFDLYKIARLLPSDQQLSLLVLARSLARHSRSL